MRFNTNTRCLPDLKTFQFFAVCFKVFDCDRDGRLSRSEVIVMLRCMKEVSRQNAVKIFDANEEYDVDVEAEADALLKSGNIEENGNDPSPDFLSIEDYLVR